MRENVTDALRAEIEHAEQVAAAVTKRGEAVYAGGVAELLHGIAYRLQRIIDGESRFHGGS